MKRIIYLFFVLLWVSCSNNKKPMNATESKVMATEDVEDFETSTTLKTQKYEKISIQKFNNYLDLLRLEQKHPEFKKDITTQLQNFSNDTLLSVNNTDEFSIENLRQVGTIETVSDSVQKIKLVYQIISGTNFVSDSVFATIISKTVIIDNKETISNKVSFSKK